MADPDLSRLAERTLVTYEAHAARWDVERPRHMREVPWLDRFVTPLRPGAHVLDLGCGAGDPIAAWLHGRGFEVTGVDGAPAMIALAARRLPDIDWRVADMRTLDLPDRFDGIVAWDSFFHLTADEQRGTLDRIAAHLKPGGMLLLTVGPEAGEVTGHVCGDPVYHASLDPTEYADRLATHAIEVVDFVAEDAACDHHTVLLARKR